MTYEIIELANKKYCSKKFDKFMKVLEEAQKSKKPDPFFTRD